MEPWMKMNENMLAYLWEDKIGKVLSIQSQMITSAIGILNFSLLIHGIFNIKYKLILPTLVWIPTSCTIELVIIIYLTSRNLFC